MILGMSTATFTALHVAISLLGIASGLMVLYGLLTARRLERWTAIFVVSTALTSLTGFAFPNAHVTPAQVVGVLSLIVLAVTGLSRYGLRMRGAWRWIYIVSASLALYFNVFVLVVQLFEKVPALTALAPTRKEPPFAIVQLLVLAAFVWVTVLAVRRFRPEGIASLPDSHPRAA